MKKTVLMLAAALLISTLFVGCENNDAEAPVEQEGNPIEKSEKADYLEEYIANLADNSAREDFLSFFNSMEAYCRGIERELERASNAESYTFNPLESESIPAELADIYDWSEIKFFSGYKSHENYEIKINGAEVEFSFDGQTFYPNNYGYSSVKDLVEKYNA